jgi:hypothetical protein
MNNPTSQGSAMEILEYLTITLFIIWCFSEIVIRMISHRIRLKSLPDANDKFSFIIIWLCTVPTVGFAILVHNSQTIVNGFGDLIALFPSLGYLVCIMLAIGINIRIIAVATLNRQFTNTG